MISRNILGILVVFLTYSQVVQASDAEEFIGTWTLHAIESLNESGNWEVRPQAVGAIGHLNYSSDGYMSYAIMMANRPQQVDVPLSGESAIQLFRTYFSIFGTFEVDEIEKTVTHNIEGHIFPNGVGTAAIRKYVLEGNKLILQQRENSRWVWMK